MWLEADDRPNIGFRIYCLGAKLVSYTILGGSLIYYSILDPQDPILILEAPTLSQAESNSCLGYGCEAIHVRVWGF